MIANTGLPKKVVWVSLFKKKQLRGTFWPTQSFSPWGVKSVIIIGKDPLTNHLVCADFCTALWLKCE